MNQTKKSINKQKIKGIIEAYAIPSFKHVAIHIFIAIMLLVLLVFALEGRVNIGTASFVAITSSLSATSGAMLAISFALTTFFSRHITDWRDRLIDKLEQGRIELANQMAKSANKHPEIAKRLAELYLQSAFYIPGQSTDVDKIYDASRIFDDWAKKEALQAQDAKKTFDFGNLQTYESFEKHLFDASISSAKVRQSLILLSAAEKASRSIAVFPPLLSAWIIILLLSIVFAILGGLGIFSTALLFPMLLMLLYLIVISLVALVIIISNIAPLTRILETGYEIAMKQLAQEPIVAEQHSNKNKKKI